MILPQRKLVIRLYLATGRTVEFVSRDLEMSRKGNELANLRWDRGSELDYVRLDNVVAITSRPSLLHWYWSLS